MVVHNDSMAKPRPIRSILEDTLKGLEIDGPVKTHSIFLNWKQVVGEAIALQSRPRSIRNRILFIDVSHPAWMQQLQFFKPTLLEKINAFLGERSIEDVRFKLGKIAPPESSLGKSPSWENERLDETTLKKIDDQLQNITDGETKLVLRDVLIKGAKLERYRRKM